MNEKPKLKNEHASEIYHMATTAGSSDILINKLVEAGYMEKPETAFERAERKFNEWNYLTDVSDSDDIVIDMADAFREAIKELTEKLENK